MNCVTKAGKKYKPKISPETKYQISQTFRCSLFIKGFLTKLSHRNTIPHNAISIKMTFLAQCGHAFASMLSLSIRKRIIPGRGRRGEKDVPEPNFTGEGTTVRMLKRPYITCEGYRVFLRSANLSQKSLYLFFLRFCIMVRLSVEREREKNVI